MNTKILLGIVLLVAVGGGFLLTQQPGQMIDSNMVTQKSPESIEEKIPQITNPTKVPTQPEPVEVQEVDLPPAFSTDVSLIPESNQPTEGGLPLIVWNSATWCHICAEMRPFVEPVMNEFEGQAYMVEVDIDKYPALASRFKVFGTPKFVMFSADGLEVGSFSGQTESEFRSQINSLI